MVSEKMGWLFVYRNHEHCRHRQSPLPYAEFGNLLPLYFSARNASGEALGYGV